MLSDRAFRLWITMITQADDEGRLVAQPEQLRVLAFGYHPQVVVEDSSNALREIAQIGLVKLYVVDGVQYAWFPSWKDHQRIDRPTPSKLPPYESVHEVSSRTRRGLALDRIGRDRKGKERRGGEGSVRETKTDTPPPPEGGASLNGFGEFWQRYPRQEGMGKAEEAWKRHTRGVALPDILDGISRWEHSEKWAEGFIPMPSTWLNQKRWKDTPMTSSRRSQAQRLWDEAQAEKERG